MSAVLGLIPVVWAYASILTAQAMYRHMTVGLVPGDTRFNDAWRFALGWTLPGYFLALPAVFLTLTAMLAYRERRRGRAWRGVVGFGVAALSLGAVGWFVGFGGLASTIWID